MFVKHVKEKRRQVTNCSRIHNEQLPTVKLNQEKNLFNSSTAFLMHNHNRNLYKDVFLTPITVLLRQTLCRHLQEYENIVDGERLIDNQ